MWQDKVVILFFWRGSKTKGCIYLNYLPRMMAYLDSQFQGSN